MIKRPHEYWLLCAVALSELEKVDALSRERFFTSIDLPTCSEVIEEAPLSLLPKILSSLLEVTGRQHLAELSSRDLCSELLCLLLRLQGCNKATIRDTLDFCLELVNESDLIDLAFAEFSGMVSEMQDENSNGSPVLFDSKIRLAFFLELLVIQSPTDRVWRSIAGRPDGSFNLLEEVHAGSPAPVRLQVLKLMAALSEASQEAFNLCRDHLLHGLQDDMPIIQEFATRALLDLVYLHARNDDEGMPDYFEAALMEGALLNGSTPEVQLAAVLGIARLLMEGIFSCDTEVMLMALLECYISAQGPASMQDAPPRTGQAPAAPQGPMSKLIDQFLATYAAGHQDEVGNTIVALVLGELQKGNLAIVPTAGAKSSGRPTSFHGPQCYLDSTLGPPHEMSSFHAKVKALLALCKSHGIIEVICKSLSINIQSMQPEDDEDNDDRFCGSMGPKSLNLTDAVTEDVCETWLLSVGRAT